MSDAMDPLLADRDAWEARTSPSHPCRDCGRTVPWAPGLLPSKVAHVKMYPSAGAACDGCHRSYSWEEQELNFEELLTGPMTAAIVTAADDMITIGPGRGHPGPNPGPSRTPLPRYCPGCGGSGSRASVYNESMEEDCPTCGGRGHL